MEKNDYLCTLIKKVMGMERQKRISHLMTTEAIRPRVVSLLLPPPRNFLIFNNLTSFISFFPTGFFMPASHCLIK